MYNSWPLLQEAHAEAVFLEECALQLEQFDGDDDADVAAFLELRVGIISNLKTFTL